MSRQRWVEPLFCSQADGPALTNSLVATSLLVAKPVIPAGFFDAPGVAMRVTVRGRISCVVTTPGTLTLDNRIAAVIAQTSQALGLNVVAKTNVAFEYEMLLVARTVGAGTAATLLGIGTFTSEAVVGSPLPSVGGSGALLIPASAPAVGTGFDSTISNTLDFFGTFSVNTATTSIQVHQYLLEGLN